DTLRTIPLIAVSEQNAVGVVSGRDFFNAPDMGSFRKKIKMVDGIPAEEQLKQILAEVPQTVRGLEQ
ncbi:MAG TPA: hypothetical protein PLV45_18280, partial [bacterium]|nr:hypothetical protein [bacterium]